MSAPSLDWRTTAGRLWREIRAFRAPPGPRLAVPRGPRILVLGNCQLRAAANAMRLLLPDAAVTFVPLPGRGRSLAELRVQARNHDIVVAGRFSSRLRDGADFASLRADLRAVELPVIVFPAFHPDLVYVTRAGGHRLVGSGTGDYHSALVVFAWLEGLGEAAAERLFDRGLMGRLGYHDLWQPSVDALLETGRAAGTDLATLFARWTRRGTFMQATNHPRMFVTVDLAIDALRRGGIVADAGEVERLLPDEFIRQGTWPVYPPIAENLGVPGSDLFATQESAGRGPTRTLSRPAFIAASYAAYARLGRAELQCARVVHWRTTPAIWRDLRAVAGER